ncbi:MAG: HEAT repeat domain-containing protein, partial [Candidatus Pacebacteria bacterium]|nr:HEAT repeat domain-containing protein [Candidatus Paceibacterota bacterium]
MIPSIIGFLDYEYDAINEKAAEVILHAVNKDNIELISRAIPKLLHLLDYHEYSIEGQKVDNTKSVDNAERAFQFISVLAPELLKDSIPVLIKYIDRDYPDNISGILEQISNQNWELLIPIISDIIERVDKKEHISIIGNVAKYDVEIIKPAVKPLIEQLDNTEFQELSAYVLGIIAQKKVELVQPAMPKLINLLSSDNEWVKINAARSLRIISQQDDNLIDESTLERLDDIIYGVNLFDEIVHSSPIENEFAYYDLALSAVNSNPNDPEALKALGEVIFKTYNLYQFDFSTKSNLRAQEKGIEYFLKSAEIRPTYETYMHIGKAYEFCTMGPIGNKMRQDYRKKCIYFHTKASELNPNDIYCNIRSSVLNHVLGNYEEAISLMEELYERVPNESEVSMHLSDFYVDAAKRLIDKKEYYGAYNFLLKANNFEEFFDRTKEELDRMLGDENLRSKLRNQINDLKKKNEILTKDTTKKFSEIGDAAYSECTTNSYDLKEDSKTKLDEILAIDTLINKSNQDIVNIKNREQKSGFLSKL